MSDEIAIEFVAEIRQTRNMVDHTYKTEFNLPEECQEQAAWLLKHQQRMAKVVLVLVDDE